jgi:iron(II)-dependent oxidoreductase
VDTGPQLARELRDARARTLQLVLDLTDEQLIGPRLPIVNPLLWEIGHVAWFQERWVLRHLRGLEPVRADADDLWDSFRVAHDDRWALALPGRTETLQYMNAVLERVLERLPDGAVTPEESYFHQLVLYHEDMHGEAFTYTRQTLGYPPPAPPPGAPAPPEPGSPVQGDAFFEGGTFLLGSFPSDGFVFDNEKWAHPIELAPFRIAKAPVTNGEFLAFVEEGGYRRPELWSEEGWRWREATGAEHPVYWRREAGGRWLERRFDRLVPLEDRLPAIHVCWYEAEAFCRWAGRRLPTEAEWEMAASMPPLGPRRKRRFPWGDEPPNSRNANLDGTAGWCASVDACPEGDTPAGCRQMIGNVWEWTATTFAPYPGFVADPYKEYSAPWFDGRHKVLRGGCWATRGRLLRNTWRNFYLPHRRDVFAGFRTCAL